MATLTNAGTYTTATELINADYIAREVEASIRDNALSLGLCRVVDIGSQPVRVVSFPKNNTYSATTKSTDDTTLANTAYNPTEAQATAAEYGAMSTITDMLQRSAVVDVMAEAAQEIGLCLIDQMETSFSALASGFSNTAGSTGVNATAANLFDAMKTLRVNAKSAAGDRPAFVLHPQQVFDIRSEGVTATANIGTGHAREDIVRMFGPGTLGAYAGDFSGIPVFQTGLQPTSSSGADRDGMLITPRAIGCALKWLPEVETQRALTLGANATVVLGTVAYGFVEIQDSFGVGVITDA